MTQRTEIEQKLTYLLSIGYPSVLVAGVRLLFDFGLRASDMLSIKRSDITLDGKIIVKQGKGSNILICNLSNDVSLWLDYRNGLHSDLSTFNYQYLYRLMKKCNLKLDGINGRNDSVTHIGRKMVAQSIYNETNDIQAVKAALGHVSEGSSLFYVSDNVPEKSNYKSINENPTSRVANLKVTKRKSGTYINVINPTSKKKK